MELRGRRDEHLHAAQARARRREVELRGRAGALGTRRRRDEHLNAAQARRAERAGALAVVARTAAAAMAEARPARA